MSLGAIALIMLPEYVIKLLSNPESREPILRVLMGVCSLVEGAVAWMQVRAPRHSIPHTARALATRVAKSSSLEKTAVIPLDRASFSMSTW